MKYQSEIGRTFKDLIIFTTSNKQFVTEINKLGKEVEQFASQFDIPGNDDI